MSQCNAGHFYEVFDRLYKDLNMIRAYMVPPYGIRWEGRIKRCFKISLKGSHHDMQIMSRRNAEYVFILKTR